MIHLFHALQLWTKVNQISTLTLDARLVRLLLVRALEIFQGTLQNWIFITSRGKGLTGEERLV
jgi:hypothetical protein